MLIYDEDGLLKTTDTRCFAVRDIRAVAMPEGKDALTLPKTK